MNSSVPKNGPVEKSTSALQEDADYALLQQPLNMGVKNVKQILNCIQNGTKEVKDIILNECNIVYECKVCQNLFRSLANFLYHKRCFCKKHICESMLLFEHFEEPEPEVIQIQPQPTDDKQKNKVSHVKPKTNSIVEGDPLSVTSKELEPSKVSSSPVKTQSTSQISNALKSTEVSSKENISSTVTEEETNETVPTKTVVSPIKIMGRLVKVSMKDRLLEGCKNVEIRALRKRSEPKPTFILKPIESSKNAVFQTLDIKEEPCKDKPKIEKVAADNVTTSSSVQHQSNNQAKSASAAPSDSDSQSEIEIIKEIKPNDATKPKVTNISNGLSKNDKKNKDILLTRRKKLLNRTDCHVQSLKCLKCDTQFTTLRTLYFHMMSLHSQKRLYYPCPFCKTLFVQIYGVTRHIISAHNKTKEQIDNKLREAIRKGAIWKRVNEQNSKERKEVIPKEEKPEISTPSKENKSSISVADGKIDEKTFHSYVKVDKVLTLHQCSKCARVFGRKSSQVSHQKFCIMNSSPCKSEEGSEFSSSPCSVEPYPLARPTSSSVTKRLSFEDGKKAIRPKRGAEKQMHKDFVNSQTLKWRSANKVDTTNRGHNISNKGEGKKVNHPFERKIKTIVNAEKLSCLKCNRRFSSYSNLRRHAAIHIGWTRYECKACKYQSYNRSDCRHHIERVHDISETDIEKHIIHLVSDIPKGKIIGNTPKKATPSKGKKKDFATSKNKIINRKKKIRRKVNSGPLTSTPIKERSPIKREIIELSPKEAKRPKKSKPLIIMKQPPIKKTQNNYKSLTTNCPTTIILSKSGQNSTMQALKNASSIAQLKQPNDNKSSTSPPKKFEVKFMTDTMSKPEYDARNNLHFPSRIFATSPIKNDPGSIGNGLSLPEKSTVKKNRDISDWLIKTDKQPIDIQFSKSPIKNESGPVIIGLVAAGNSNIRNKGQTAKLT